MQGNARSVGSSNIKERCKKNRHVEEDIFKIGKKLASAREETNLKGQLDEAEAQNGSTELMAKGGYNAYMIGCSLPKVGNYALGISVRGAESWEAGWEELYRIWTVSGKIRETILLQRFFIFKYSQILSNKTAVTVVVVSSTSLFPYEKRCWLQPSTAILLGDGQTIIVLWTTWSLLEAKPFREDGLLSKHIAKSYQIPSTLMIEKVEVLTVYTEGKSIEEKQGLMAKLSTITLLTKLNGKENEIFATRVADTRSGMGNDYLLNLIRIKKVSWDNMRDIFFVDDVDPQKTFSFVGFAHQLKKGVTLQILLLNIKLKLKSEQGNIEIRQHLIRLVGQSQVLQIEVSKGALVMHKQKSGKDWWFKFKLKTKLLPPMKASEHQTKEIYQDPQNINKKIIARVELVASTHSFNSIVELGKAFGYYTDEAASVVIKKDTLTGDFQRRAVDIMWDLGFSLNMVIDVAKQGAVAEEVVWVTLVKHKLEDVVHQWKWRYIKDWMFKFKSHSRACGQAL